MNEAVLALEVEDLHVLHRRGDQQVALVDGISFAIRQGEIFGLVGESGSGKSISALATVRLLGSDISTRGSVKLDGRELLELSEVEMRKVRGGRISMIFQEPTTALNPVFTVGTQIVAAIRAHLPMTRIDARKRAEQLLRQVGIPDPASRLNYYPHQLQAEIVRLLEQLVRENGLSLLFISHDLGLVARVCDRVAVAYAGQIVESGETETLLRSPMHPYMQGLVKCVADFEEVGTVRGGIPGNPPLPGSWLPGCRFQPRCTFATDGCEKPQPLREIRPGHAVRCWRADSIAVEAVAAGVAG
jgi:peptide/nickel transport system ATP-binding protein